MRTIYAVEEQEIQVELEGYKSGISIDSSNCCTCLSVSMDSKSSLHKNITELSRMRHVTATQWLSLIKKWITMISSLTHGLYKPGAFCEVYWIFFWHQSVVPANLFSCVNAMCEWIVLPLWYGMEILMLPYLTGKLKWAIATQVVVPTILCYLRKIVQYRILVINWYFANISKYFPTDLQSLVQ